MNKSFHCAFCNADFPITPDTTHFVHVDDDTIWSHHGFNVQNIVSNIERNKRPERIDIHLYHCPRCDKVSVQSIGVGEQYEGEKTNIFPNSLAKQYPDYIPKQIRQDYEEAYAIINLSPKASATLSRRALQSMIRDFYGINNKSRLIDEINSIESKVSPAEKTVLDNLRKIGNIGAHPEEKVETIVDIEPGESEKLLKVIEYFMKSWYIDRHDAEELFSEVKDTNEKLQNQRKQGK